MSVAALSQTSILIRWDLPQVLEQNGPIVGYEIVLTYTNGSSRVYSSPLGDVFNLQIEGISQTCMLPHFFSRHVLSSGLPKFVNVGITAAARTPAGIGPASMPIVVNATQIDGRSR